VSNFIILTEDIVHFMPIFGEAIVTTQEGKISGSGKSSVEENKVCRDGDEKDISIPNCTYMTKVYPLLGTGTLKIDSLEENQKSKKMKDSGKPVLIKGRKFKAVFEVHNPAKAPPKGAAPPELDQTKKYSGKGIFISSNIKWETK